MIDGTSTVASVDSFGPLLVDVAGSTLGFRDVAAAVIFVGFFAAAGVALARADDERLRTAFLGCLLLGLAVPGVTGLEPYPFVDMREFTSPASETETAYEIRVVDARGSELAYDPRAAPPMIDSTLREQGERMVEEYDSSECRAIARHLLEEAREYRSAIESRGPLSVDLIDFPHHKIGYRWTPDVVEDRDAFVGIRVYRVDLDTTDDGRTVESATEAAVIEFRPPSRDETAAERTATEKGTTSATASESAMTSATATAGGCSDAGVAA